jgi:hypothetical protein
MMYHPFYMERQRIAARRVFWFGMAVFMAGEVALFAAAGWLHW